MKANDLLIQHPELNEQKVQVEKILNDLKAPKVQIDKDFSSQLKHQLRAKIQEKKAENPKYLAFYLEHFRFYFTGFSVALGCFMILFVLGFFSFNKTPQLLSNPKILSFKESEAFWPLPKQKIKQFASTSHLATNFSLNSNEDHSSLLGSRETSANLTSATARYHIWEKQLPKLDNEYYIAKTTSGNNAELNQLTKALHLPDFSLSKLAKSQINFVNFTDHEGKYQFSLDLKNNTLSAEKVHIPIQENPKSDSLSDKEIKKLIKKQLSSFGISLKYYWDPTIQTNEYDSSRVDLFYPKIIDGKMVWSMETQDQEGLTLSFDRISKEILTFYNFKFQSYDLSEYPTEWEQTEFLTQIGTLGNIDTSKKGEGLTIPMKKGELVYLQQGNFLIPGLMFQAKATNFEDNLFISLY